MCTWLGVGVGVAWYSGCTWFRLEQGLAAEPGVNGTAELGRARDAHFLEARQVRREVEPAHVRCQPAHQQD